MGISIGEALKLIAENGIQTVLLIIFIWYFFQRDKEREKELGKQQLEVQNEITAAKRINKEREALLMSENAKREEMLRQEAAKREDVLRQESQKRENALMLQMNSMSESMKDISKSMENINMSITKTFDRLEQLEEKVTRMSTGR